MLDSIWKRIRAGFHGGREGDEKGFAGGVRRGSGADDAEGITPALDTEVGGMGGEEGIGSAGGEVGPSCWGEPGRVGGREIA